MKLSRLAQRSCAGVLWVAAWIAAVWMMAVMVGFAGHILVLGLVWGWRRAAIDLWWIR